MILDQSNMIINNRISRTGSVADTHAMFDQVKLDSFDDRQNTDIILNWQSFQPANNTEAY